MKTRITIEKYVEEVKNGEDAEGTINSKYQVKEARKDKLEYVSIASKAERPNQNGEFIINFSERVAWPENVSTWTSENIGATFLMIEYEPSANTLDDDH